MEKYVDLITWLLLYVLAVMLTAALVILVTV